MENNRINLEDNIRVEIYDDGHKVDTVDLTGLHNVSDAVDAAYRNSKATFNPIEDYVWRVSNLTTDTSARYRVDAGGHLRILPEERP